MLDNKLNTQIVELHKKIKDISFINFGGCAHFAYFLSKRLKDLNIEHDIVAFDADESIKEKCANLSVRIKDGIGDMACSHVMIAIGEFYIDGSDIIKKGNSTWFSYNYDKKKFNYNYDKISFNKLRLMRQHGNWSDHYDKLQNRKLHNYIKQTVK